MRRGTPRGQQAAAAAAGVPVGPAGSPGGIFPEVYAFGRGRRPGPAAVPGKLIIDIVHALAVFRT